MRENEKKKEKRKRRSGLLLLFCASPFLFILWCLSCVLRARLLMVRRDNTVLVVLQILFFHPLTVVRVSFSFSIHKS